MKDLFSPETSEFIKRHDGTHVIFGNFPNTTEGFVACQLASFSYRVNSLTEEIASLVRELAHHQNELIETRERASAFIAHNSNIIQPKE